MSFYSNDELKEIGFKSLGNNVYLSKKASIYGAKNISIGDNSRVDDFCVLSISDNGEIKIGKNVHIAIYSSLIGKENIEINDYANISSRVNIYSSSDDFSGIYMTNPTVATEYTNVISKPVKIEKHVIIGSGTVLLPGVNLSEGVAVGALSLVTKSFDENQIIGGQPARVIKKRQTGYKQCEANLLSNQ